MIPLIESEFDFVCESAIEGARKLEERRGQSALERATESLQQAREMRTKDVSTLEGSASPAASLLIAASTSASTAASASASSLAFPHCTLPLSASSCLFLDDLGSNLKSARRFGFRTILCPFERVHQGDRGGREEQQREPRGEFIKAAAAVATATPIEALTVACTTRPSSSASSCLSSPLLSVLAPPPARLLSLHRNPHASHFLRGEDRAGAAVDWEQGAE